MTIRPYLLAETNWKEVKKQTYKVAILPWGAIEAHNYHLPYGTDFYLAESLAEKAASQVWSAGEKIIVLPGIPFGVNTGQIDIPLCINMNPSTQLAVLRDIVEVVSAAGIHKLVILNAHGANYFKSMIRELYLPFPETFICAINWWNAIDPTAYFDEPGDHAGELETSAMMYIQPDKILPLSEAGSGDAIPYRISGLNEGWVQSQRLWTKATKDTGVGNPALSTPEKGAAYVEDCAQKISTFLLQLAQTEVDDLYEP